MDNRGVPTKFFDGFDHAAGEEDNSLVVFGREDVGFKPSYGVALEIVFVVDELYLHPSWLQSGNFD